MNKKNIIALLILVLLAGVFMLIKMNEPTEKVFYYFGDNSDNYHTIIIADTTGTITLVKNNEKWEMTDPVESPIKSKKSEDLLNKLTSVKSSSLPISVSQTAQSTYNVTDSLGTLVTILDKDGNTLRKALIGKADNYNFSYARHPQSNEIFQLTENLSWVLKADVKNWRENIILELNTDNILDFQVISPERNYTFTYADSLWKFKENDFTQDVKDDNKIMKKLLSRFKSLRATDFLDKEFENYEELLNNPHLSIKINTSDNEAKILTIIPYNATSDLLQFGSQQSPLYLIQKNIREDFNFDLTELVAE